MIKKRKWLLLLTVIALVMGACSKDESVLEDDVQEIEEKENSIDTAVTLSKEPFTGVIAEEVSNRRPVLVTINNHPHARPQSGLSDADIIYEFVAEGNVTRFLALFQSSLPDEIGPVRSARDYFVHLAKGLDAFYVAHGYSPDAQKLLQSGAVDNVNGMQYDGSLFWRAADRKAPHNSYISGENIIAAEEQTGAATEISKQPQFNFYESIEEARAGDLASTIDVHYGKNPDFMSTYTYDTTKETYNRSVNGTVTIDKANEQSIEISNLLILEANHRTIDSEGRQSVDIESGGKGMLFQAGTVKPVEWENRDGLLMPIVEGAPAKFVPGKMWIHIVSTNPGMDTSVTYTP
ncbi:DUF3048 domain-containing protein [Sporosarcina sp. HYO08]|uniref:DUF3048 domain-containing protein n=1 Tax=Sporosarcina sp. HYO08 TaxID=1759557 RepID=UPI0007924802|nr:DUF3048 domain-containing protein [Sporosarcina sp. HYO08]KXH86766.1 hypothetical protein AU377_14215 [Sporosarcina sp. HYO08]